jgi:Fur family iron response transcriptional regulator
MTGTSPFDEAQLRRLGVRPTGPRLALLRLLRDHDGSHVTALQAYQIAQDRGMRLTLGTVYNVLNDFVRAGAIRRMEIGDRTCFCANQQPHHHFFDEDNKRLFDIPGRQPSVGDIPAAPPGMEIVGIDVIVRVRPISAEEGG